MPDPTGAPTLVDELEGTLASLRSQEQQAQERYASTGTLDQIGSVIGEALTTAEGQIRDVGSLVGIGEGGAELERQVAESQFRRGAFAAPWGVKALESAVISAPATIVSMAPGMGAGKIAATVARARALRNAARMGLGAAEATAKATEAAMKAEALAGRVAMGLSLGTMSAPAEYRASYETAIAAGLTPEEAHRQALGDAMTSIGIEAAATTVFGRGVEALLSPMARRGVAGVGGRALWGTAKNLGKNIAEETVEEGLTEYGHIVREEAWRPGYQGGYNPLRDPNADRVALAAAAGGIMGAGFQGPVVAQDLGRQIAAIASQEGQRDRRIREDAARMRESALTLERQGPWNALSVESQLSRDRQAADVRRLEADLAAQTLDFSSQFQTELDAQLAAFAQQIGVQPGAQPIPGAPLWAPQRGLPAVLQPSPAMPGAAMAPPPAQGAPDGLQVEGQEGQQAQAPPESLLTGGAPPTAEPGSPGALERWGASMTPQQQAELYQELTGEQAPQGFDIIKGMAPERYPGIREQSAADEERLRASGKAVDRDTASIGGPWSRRIGDFRRARAKLAGAQKRLEGAKTEAGRKRYTREAGSYEREVKAARRRFRRDFGLEQKDEAQEADRQARQFISNKHGEALAELTKGDGPLGDADVERAQNALESLRELEASGERPSWLGAMRLMAEGVQERLDAWREAQAAEEADEQPAPPPPAPRPEPGRGDDVGAQPPPAPPPRTPPVEEEGGGAAPEGVSAPKTIRAAKGLTSIIGSRALTPATAEGRTLNNLDLDRALSPIFGGTLAEGAYTIEQAYESLQLAVNMMVRDAVKRGKITLDDPQAALAYIDNLMSVLPTQARRATEQIELQQFSTPPNLAYLVGWLANPQPGDTVLEPSIGTGSLAAVPLGVGATVIGNELDPARAELARSLGADVFVGDAGQVQNVIARERPDAKVSVVVMNPPFSRSKNSLGQVIDDRNMGGRHIIAALKTLPQGGRLIAIVGEGMKPGSPGYMGVMKDIAALGAVRANVGISGKEYRKYGTSFGVRVLVIEKGGDKAAGHLTGDHDTVAQALQALTPVRRTMTAPAQEPAAPPPPPGPKKPSGDMTDAEKIEAIIKAAKEKAAQKSKPPAPPPGPPGPPPKPPPADDGLDDLADLAADIRKPKLREGDNADRYLRAVATVLVKRSIRTFDALVAAVTEKIPDAAALQGFGEAVEAAYDAAVGMGLADDRAGVTFASRAPSPPSNQPPNPTDPPSPPPQEPADQGAFTTYVSAYNLHGAQPHGVLLVESAAMASTKAPALKANLDPLKDIIRAGRLSAAQAEQIARATDAFATNLPSGERQGYLIGDGTGVGKGRTIAGVILNTFASMPKGKRKAVWISQNSGLRGDAARDLGALLGMTGEGGMASPEASKKVRLLSDFRPSKAKKGKKETDSAYQPVKVEDESILFTTYATIGKSANEVAGDRDQIIANAKKRGEGRLFQLIEFLGEDFDGVIAFDEAHNMANATSSKGSRGRQEASKQSLVGQALQKIFPKARILYVSATAATEVSNLGYMNRLGLWGPGSAFTDRETFMTRITGQGLAALELISRDLKALGLYQARQISFEGVEYEQKTHVLSGSQREHYGTLADAWQRMFDQMTASFSNMDGMKSAERRNMVNQFWSAHQRFFNYILLSQQMPTVIDEVRAALARGEAPVVQLVNTNEAQLDAALEGAGIKKKKDGEDDDAELPSFDDLDVTPFQSMVDFINNHWPVHRFEPVQNDDGSTTMVPTTEIDQDAVIARDTFIAEVQGIQQFIPEGPLDTLLRDIGYDTVAEVSGRSRRFEWRKQEDGTEKRVLVTIPPKARHTQAAQFQAGERTVLVFSGAGATGSSFHADKNAKNQKRRRHIIVQPGWNAAIAVQSMGRTHRTNQVQPPAYSLISTDMSAQKRFTSSVARRIEQLGALTRGQRTATGGAIFTEDDNLENVYAEHALRMLHIALGRSLNDGLERDAVLPPDDVARLVQRLEDAMPEGIDNIADYYSSYTRLQVARQDGAGEWKVVVPDKVTQWLNRLLTMPPDMQDAIFEFFDDQRRQIIAQAKADGTYDFGMRELDGENHKIAERKQVAKDPTTGALTEYVRVTADFPTVTVPFAQMQQASGAGTKQTVYYKNKKSGQVWAAVQDEKSATVGGRIVNQYRVYGPISTDGNPAGYRGKSNAIDLFGEANDKVDIIGEPAARTAWDETIRKAPPRHERVTHFIVGQMIRLWDRLPQGRTEAYRFRPGGAQSAMLGLKIPVTELSATLERLGVGEGVTISSYPAAIDAVLAGGTITFANGWKLNDRRLLSGRAIELNTGGDRRVWMDLERRGAVVERPAVGQAQTYLRLPNREAPAILQYIVETLKKPVTSVRDAAGNDIDMGGDRASEPNAGYDGSPASALPAGATTETALARGRTSPADDPALMALLMGTAATDSVSLTDGETIAFHALDYVENRSRGFNVRGRKVRTPEDAATLMQMMRSPVVERLFWMVLNDKGKVVESQVHSVGAIDGVDVPNIDQPTDMRGIVEALKRAGPGSKLVFAHNHPSGRSQPSNPDRAAYARMGAFIVAQGYGWQGIIIDGDNFHYQDSPGGEFLSGKMERKPQPWELAPVGAGARLATPEAVAAFGQQVRLDPAATLILLMDPQQGVKAVTTQRGFPSPATIYEAQMNAGATGAIIVAKAENPDIRALTTYGSNVQDIVLLTTDGGFTSQVRALGFAAGGRKPAGQTVAEPTTGYDASEPGPAETNPPPGTTPPPPPGQGRPPPGRPDLANPMGPQTEDRPVTTEVDQARNLAGEPGYRGHAEVKAAAEAAYRADPLGVERRLVDRLERDPRATLSDQETWELTLVLRALGRESRQDGGDDAAGRLRYLLYLYRQTRAETARALAIGRDELLGPAERIAAVLEEALVNPSQKVQATLDEIQERVKQARDGVQAADAATARRQGELADAEKQVGALADELRQAEARGDVAQAQVDDIRRRLADAQQAMAEARAALETAQRMAEGYQKQLAAAVDERKRILDDQKAELAKIRKALAQAGISLDALLARLERGEAVPVEEVTRALDEIRSARADVWDKLYEWWINSILSAFTTLAANTASIGWWASRTLVGNQAASLIALLTGEFGRAAAISRGSAAAIDAATSARVWDRAWKNMVFTWKNRIPGLSVDIGTKRAGTTMEAVSGGIDTDMQRKAAIGGLFGRIVRTPMAAMMAIDEFLKTIITYSEVADAAEQIAEDNQGITQAEREALIQGMVEDPNSPAWEIAVKRGLRYTFNANPNAFAQVFLKARQNIPGLRYALPFITTPTNILVEGAKSSPLGAADVATRLWNRLGKAEPTKADPDFWQDIGQQAMTWAVTIILAGMILDRDDDELPLITGTGGKYTPAKGTKAEKIPNQSILIPGVGYVSYARFEPFATMLAITVDSLELYRDARRDHKTKIAARIMQNTTGLVKDKTFLAGLGGIIKALEGETDIATGTARFAASWVPNILRQPERQTDQWRAEQKVWGRPTWRRVLQRISEMSGITGQEGKARIDVWGDPIPTDELDAAGIVIPSQVVNRKMTDIERSLLATSRARPDEAYFPTRMKPWIDVKKPSGGTERQYLTDDQFQRMQIEAGTLIKQRLAPMVRQWQADNKSRVLKPWQIDRIKQTVSAVRKQVRANYRTPATVGDVADEE